MPTSALLAQEQADVIPVRSRLEAEPLLRVAALLAQPAHGGTERGKVALGRDDGFRHAQGRSQAASSTSTSFTVSSYKRVQPASDSGSTARPTSPPPTAMKETVK
jgi:hypothetical protein